MYIFMDDTNLIEMAKFPTNNIKNVISNMQRALDVWGGLIRATGGTLVLEKTFWYLIDFEWRHGKWTYAGIDDLPATLTMPNTNQETHKIEKISLETA